MSLEEKVRTYKELRAKIKEMEAQTKTLIAEILELMPTETKSIRVAEYQVRRWVRFSVRTSLETARLFDATKMEEVVDKDRLKQLFEQGHPIPDVSQSQLINITKIKKPVADLPIK